MAKTIVQKVIFKKTTPKVLYDLYMNAALHSMISSAPAEILPVVGSSYSTHGGYITGKILHLVEDRLIVQTWRAQGWDTNAIDSTFIINLQLKGKNVILYAVHANVPDEHASHIAKGWYDHYWNPWMQHIAGVPITRPIM